MIAGLDLEAIPLGRLVLPKTSTPVVFYVNGERTERSDEGFELTAGEHVIRAVNRPYWIDVTTRVEVPPGESLTPEIPLPEARHVDRSGLSRQLQGLPRRRGGRWTFIDTTPLEKTIAVGSYELRVEFVPTGETREESVKITPGRQDPLRFSFAGSNR